MIVKKWSTDLFTHCWPHLSVYHLPLTVYRIERTPHAQTFSLSTLFSELRLPWPWASSVLALCFRIFYHLLLLTETTPRVATYSMVTGLHHLKEILQNEDGGESCWGGADAISEIHRIPKVCARLHYQTEPVLKPGAWVFVFPLPHLISWKGWCPPCVDPPSKRGNGRLRCWFLQSPVFLTAKQTIAGSWKRPIRRLSEIRSWINHYVIVLEDYSIGTGDPTLLSENMGAVDHLCR